MKLKTRRFTALVLATVAVMLITGTTAYAVRIGRLGTSIDRVQLVHSTDATVNTSAAFTDVPSATTTIVIPAGQRRMLLARYSAESACAGPASSWCAVRIVYRPTNVAALTELDPQSGTDFAFDSAGTTASNGFDWESHAIERSTPFLAAGTYEVKVQAALISATSLRLDDWTLAVERVTP